MSSTIPLAMVALARKLVPAPLRILLTTVGFYGRFATRYGHLRSRFADDVIDENGDPIPWYTYPAAEYLAGLDFSDKTVFEFGGGNSTLYWAKRAKHVTTVDHDEQYIQWIARRAPDNVTLIHESDLDLYPATVKSRGERYDVIVIDGTSRTRSGCAPRAVEHLNPGGMIVLDNSDWYPETARFLRDQNLIEVDMHGMGPRGKHTWTTSLFLDRAFVATPRTSRLPGYSKCAKHFVSHYDRYPETPPANGSPLVEHDCPGTSSAVGS